MKNHFKGSHFTEEIFYHIIRLYLKYYLSYRNLKEILEGHDAIVDYSAITRLLKDMSY